MAMVTVMVTVMATVMAFMEMLITKKIKTLYLNELRILSKRYKLILKLEAERVELETEL